MLEPVTSFHINEVLDYYSCPLKWLALRNNTCNVTIDVKVLYSLLMRKALIRTFSRKFVLNVSPMLNSIQEEFANTWSDALIGNSGMIDDKPTVHAKSILDAKRFIRKFCDKVTNLNLEPVGVLIPWEYTLDGYTIHGQSDIVMMSLSPFAVTCLNVCTHDFLSKDFISKLYSSIIIPSISKSMKVAKKNITVKELNIMDDTFDEYTYVGTCPKTKKIFSNLVNSMSRAYAWPVFSSCSKCMLNSSCSWSVANNQGRSIVLTNISKLGISYKNDL